MGRGTNGFAKLARSQPSRRIALNNPSLPETAIRLDFRRANDERRLVTQVLRKCRGAKRAADLLLAQSRAQRDLGYWHPETHLMSGLRGRRRDFVQPMP